MTPVPTPVLSTVEAYAATVPPNGILVRTRSELLAAWASHDAVILESGVWDGVVVPAGKTLASRTLHDAWLPFVQVASGASVRGVQLNPVANGVGVKPQGVRDVTISDVFIYGRSAASAGIQAYACSGLVVERVHVVDCLDYGVFVAEYGGAKTVPAGYQPHRISDVVANRIRRATPGSSNGTAEAGLWLGQPCTVTRAMANDAGWSGFETNGAFADSHVSNLHSSRCPVALYLEHFSLRSTFTDAVFYPTHAGVNCEWDRGVPGEAASRDNTFTRFNIHGGLVGFYLDAGTTLTSIRWSSFYAQKHAGIVDYQGVRNDYAIGGNVWCGADAAQPWPSGVPRITTGHPASGASGVLPTEAITGGVRSFPDRYMAEASELRRFIGRDKRSTA